MKSLKLNPDLWQRVVEHARKSGYSSPEEFVEHVLERELARDDNSSPAAKEVERRLKGLGYLE